jgi:lipopolysaccharide export LptBFGC system permease protein LptF
LRRADHSSKESYRVKKDYETEKEAKAQQRAVEPLMMMMMNYIARPFFTCYFFWTSDSIFPWCRQVLET